MDNNLVSFRTNKTTQNNFISFGLKILGPSTLAFALDKINYLSPLAQIGSRFSASIILPGALGITTYLLSRVILNCQTFKSLAQRPIPKALVDIAITTVAGAVFKALATLIFAKSQVVIIPTVIFGILLGTGIYFINQIANNCLSGKRGNRKENESYINSTLDNSSNKKITNDKVTNLKSPNELVLTPLQKTPLWSKEFHNKFIDGFTNEKPSFDLKKPYFEFKVNVQLDKINTRSDTIIINYLEVELNHGERSGTPYVEYLGKIDITHIKTFADLAPQIVSALEGSEHKEALKAWQFLANPTY